MMKKINILVIVVLSLAAGYLIYKLWIEEDWSRLDYWLLIIILAVGSVNSEIMMWRKKGDKIS